LFDIKKRWCTLLMLYLYVPDLPYSTVLAVQAQLYCYNMHDGVGLWHIAGKEQF
jgi:hypothetical protein